MRPWGETIQHRSMGEVVSIAFAVMVSASLSHASSLTDEAQTAWSHREQPGQTEMAIELWDKAFKENPSQTEILILLTKASGRAFRHANANDRKHWADVARRYGETAIAKNPQSSDAYAQYGAALGQWAQMHKGIHSVKVVREAMELLRRSVAMDAKNALPHMLLAEIFRRAPHWITKGDKAKALEEAHLAAQLGNTYAINHLTLARALLDNGDKEGAISELGKILDLPAPPDAIPEHHSDQETARELLNKLGGTVQRANPSTSSTPNCGSDGMCKETGAP